MKKLFALLMLAACAAEARSQAIINTWWLNTTGKTASYWKNNSSTPGGPPNYTWTTTTDSADALRVCYNSDTVWVYGHNMTDSMGKWSNPGNPVAQNYVHRFPRNPVVPATHTISPKIGEIGMLVNGIVIYGLGDANSWSGTTNTNGQQGGQGVWNVEVGRGEGVSLDNTLGAHPQQGGVYHTHVAPYKLWNRQSASVHSPIVGWAFDGYPVYGPYGYSTAMDATSAVSRMKTGYSLRNITARTNYPAIPGGGAATPQQGPAVSGAYPIGTYCEDYEWLASNGGDLDEYNGRFCVTPEFPNGTYAYFVTIDAAGTPVFPYYIGIYYKGQPDLKNFPAGQGGNGLSVPAYLTSCRTASGVGIGSLSGSEAPLSIFPNPAVNGRFTIRGNGHGYNAVTVVDMQGRRIYTAPLQGTKDCSIALPVPGVYLVRCERGDGGPAQVQRVVMP